MFCVKTSIQNSSVQSIICLNCNSDYEIRKILAYVAGIPFERRAFPPTTRSPSTLCSCTNSRANQKSRSSSIAGGPPGVFVARAGKLSIMLVKVDAENKQKSKQVAKEVVEEHMKAIEKRDGKATLLTTNEILLEAGNGILFPVLQWNLLLTLGATEQTKERLKR